MAEDLHIYNDGTAANLLKGGGVHVSIPDGVRKIGFGEHPNTTLRSVDLPDSLVEIGKGAFYECHHLHSIEFPGGLTSIGDYAFRDCYSLQSVVFPEGLISIGNSAFYGCKSLELVQFPDSLLEIKPFAFGECSSLLEVLVPDNIETIDENAFRGCSAMRRLVLNKRFSDVHFELPSDVEVVFVDNVAMLLCKQQAEQRAEEFLGKGRELIRGGVSASAKIEDDSFDLSGYIGAVADTECAIELLKSNLASLYCTYGLATKEGARQVGAKRRMLLEERRETERRLNAVRNAKVEDVGEAILEMGFSYKITPKLPKKPRKGNYVKASRRPIEPVYEKPGLFNRRKVEEENERRRKWYEERMQEFEQGFAKYDAAMEKYERTMAACRSDWEKRVRPRCCKDLEVALEKCDEKLRRIEGSPEHAARHPDVEFVRNEVEKAERSITDLLQGLERLYSFGIVHPKYRNLVAMCTMHEYLETGRCSELKGSDGAYNLYENELRADLVISKLEDIDEHLAQVRDNQFELISRLEEMNKKVERLSYGLSNALSEINAGVKKANEHLGVVAASSVATAYAAETTAFYAEQQTKLLDSIGLMTAFCAVG